MAKRGFKESPSLRPRLQEMRSKWSQTNTPRQGLAMLWAALGSLQSPGVWGTLNRRVRVPGSGRGSGTFLFTNPSHIPTAAPLPARFSPRFPPRAKFCSYLQKWCPPESRCHGPSSRITPDLCSPPPRARLWASSAAARGSEGSCTRPGRGLLPPGHVFSANWFGGDLEGSLLSQAA